MKKIILLLVIFFNQPIFAQNVDIDLLRIINTPNKEKFGDPFFKEISSTTYVFSLAAPASVFAMGIVNKNKELRYKSYQMAVGLGLSSALSLLLKYSVNRTRPYITYSFIVPKIKESDPSFPSGHATNAFETATSLSLNFPKWYVIVPAYAWAGAVGYSRMYLGVHYPSDILAGMVLGAGSAWITWKVNKIMHRKRIVSPIE
ncbi:MAG TPA: phosphatase PAP2 family protein [Cytophagaceae bacterium]|jgi:membrane-associated phospholipid phosphatase|nr:phosphatase PAP2 family protein [Cytophagaceae bacterium]